MSKLSKTMKKKKSTMLYVSAFVQLEAVHSVIFHALALQHNGDERGRKNCWTAKSF